MLRIILDDLEIARYKKIQIFMIFEQMQTSSLLNMPQVAPIYGSIAQLTHIKGKLRRSYDIAGSLL